MNADFLAGRVLMRVDAAQVIVITGDNKLTAEAICRQIGVFEDGQDLARKSMTGRDFLALPPEERMDVLGVRNVLPHQS